MKKNDVIISTVVTVYNNFDLMSNLLHSFNNQFDKEFEVIFVDDCSTDDSLKKLKSKSKNFKFKYKILKNVSNLGPGVSRNNGISKCSGKYITFIDADDYIPDNFFERILFVIKNNSFDCLIFDYYIEENYKKRYVNSLPINSNDFVSSDAMALSNGMCWGKIYVKDVIISNNILFPDLMRSEDLAFVKIYLSKCKNIKYLHEALYYYVQNSNSIMHNSKTLDVSNNEFAFNYICKYVKKSASLEMIFIREYLYLIVQIMSMKNVSNHDIKEFINRCYSIYPFWYNNAYIKYQPAYLRFILLLIRFRFIFVIKLIFKLKK